MKKIFIICISVFIINWDSFSQEKIYYTKENVDQIERDYPVFLPMHSVYDSLIVGKKVFYFKNSPVDYLEGYLNILYDKEATILPEIDTGYRLLWIIDNNKLYIKNISSYWADPPVMNKNTKLEKLEKFLGRKFEKNRIFADFVTGKFILYKYPLSLRKLDKKGLNKRYRNNQEMSKGEDIYRKNLIGKQKIYIVEFENGILVKLFRDKQKEKEYKQWEKEIPFLGNPFI